MPTYSLDSIEIDGFRGLRKVCLEGLGLVNILVGPNNCGKTSVLEAISVLCNPLDPFEWLAMVRRRDFGRLDETRIQSLRWCFPQSGHLDDPEFIYEGLCSVRCSGAFELRRLEARYRDLVGEPALKNLSHRDRARERDELEIDVFELRRGAIIAHTVDLATGPLELDMHETVESEFWEDELAARPRLRTTCALPGETLTPYSYQINRVQVRNQSQSKFTPDRELVLDVLREFDPDVTDIDVASFRGARPSIYLRHRHLGPAPLSVFGDALRRAALLASTLPRIRGGVLLIDEIEAGIHVSALQRVLSWLIAAAKRLNVQIVATTHSLEAVDAMLAAQIDEPASLVAFHLPALGKGDIKRFTGDSLDNLRFERGLDIR